MALLFGGETAQFTVDGAVRLLGPDSMRRGHLLEHLYREVRATRLCQRPAAVQHAIITSDLARGAPA